jgi:malate synthase
MAAQIPIRTDPDANRRAIEKVRADKLREVKDGHDGTWVAHPGLVSVAREAFREHMTGDHQLHRLREDLHVTAADLLEVPQGPRTMDGLRTNVRIGVRYLESWLAGTGCVPLDHLMEDAATAEISRAQLWQWLRHGATLDGGTPVTERVVLDALDEGLARIRSEVGGERFASGRFDAASTLFRELCLADEMDEFLTLRAYEMLDGPGLTAP